MNTEAMLRDVELAARTMGMQIEVLKASTSREIDLVFDTFRRARPVLSENLIRPGFAS
jgi:hypothetical protein